MSHPSQATYLLSFTRGELEIATRRAAWNLLSERVVHFVKAVAAKRAARLAIEELEARDDHELRDMGILRSEIRRVVGQKRPASAIVA